MERELGYHESKMLVNNITQALQEKVPIKSPLIKTAEKLQEFIYSVDSEIQKVIFESVEKDEAGNAKLKEGVEKLKTLQDLDIKDFESFSKKVEELESQVVKINIEQVSPKRAAFVGSKMVDLDTFLEQSSEVSGKTVVLLQEYFISKN
jgi:hypothetical protein